MNGAIHWLWFYEMFKRVGYPILFVKFHQNTLGFRCIMFCSPRHINNIECSVHSSRVPCFRRKILDKGLLTALKEELLSGRKPNRIVPAQSGKDNWPKIGVGPWKYSFNQCIKSNKVKRNFGSNTTWKTWKGNAQRRPKYSCFVMYHAQEESE